MKYVESNQGVRNYDYSKFAVYNDKNRFLTNVYKHSKAFYNLFERTPHETMDKCLYSLPNHIKNK